MPMLYNRTALDQDLAEIRDNILRMGSLVDQMTQRAVHALVDRDMALARQVRAEEKVLDQLRYTVEEKCIETIAMQAPLAGDLRQVFAIAHMAVELERMADYANGIAKIVMRMGSEPPLKPLIDIPRMQVVVGEMLRQSLDAFVRRDVELARAVMERDDEVDSLYKQILAELISYMAADPQAITRAQYLVWVAHNLEREGDRVVNICERIVYLVTGTLHEPKKPKQPPV